MGCGANPQRHGLKILIVKLSSLGDVVHTLPVVHDLRSAFASAQVDWVVERGFAPLVRRCEGVRRVVECELRRWRKAPLAGATRAEWRAFRSQLQRESYDAVIDLQGLTKSALVARMARLAPGGRRYAMGNRSEGSSYEPATRWLADVAVPVEPKSHAVQRGRDVCAAALGYQPAGAPRYGLAPVTTHDNTVLLLHGTSRADKCWPEERWLALGQRLLAQGRWLGLPHGSDEERERSERLAAALGPRAQVWPRLSLDALADRMARCAGAIGVDSGLSHLAVALDLPHVQIYNFDTAWRTGPIRSERQRSVVDTGVPSVAAVWQAWGAVTMPG
jgi:heptosyltransferase-1